LIKETQMGNAARVTQSDIPTTGLRTYVADFARRQGIQDVRTGQGALARVITGLADDEVTPDATERLIIALRRAKAIDGPTMLTIQGRYLDEKFNVRPVR
jgi:hypothetical protein